MKLLEDRRFYVYIYSDPIIDNEIYSVFDLIIYGRPFYIGKGSGKRWYTHILNSFNEKNNSFLINKIRKLRKKYNIDPIIDIVKLNLTEQEAYKLEIDLISFFGRRDISEKGILVNLTDGGDGIRGSSSTWNKGLKKDKDIRVFNQVTKSAKTRKEKYKNYNKGDHFNSKNDLPSDQELEKMINLYKEGYSIYDIANKYNITRKKLERWIKRKYPDFIFRGKKKSKEVIKKLNKHNKNYKEIDIKILYEMKKDYESGYTFYKLSKKYKYTETVIRNRFNEYFSEILK